LSLKNDIIDALKASAEPLDRTTISSLCLSGTDKQIADQLHLLKKAGTIIGEKQRGGTFLYRMPTESEGDVLRRAVSGMVAVGDKTDANGVALSMRSEAEVDYIEPERIDAAALHRVFIEDHFPDAGKMIAVEVPSDDVLEAPAEDVKRYINVWPGPTLAELLVAANEMKSQLESAVSETVEDETEEPIKQESPPFRVGVYSDGTMVLEKSGGGLFELDKAQFAVLAEFARTVGWLE